MTRHWIVNDTRLWKIKDIPSRMVRSGEAIKYFVENVLFKHPNWSILLRNLSNIYVKKGEKVSTMQELGNIITNKNSGQTILSFSLFKESKTQNPLYWLGQK